MEAAMRRLGYSKGPLPKKPRLGMLPKRRIGMAKKFDVHDADGSVLIRAIDADQVVASFAPSLTAEEVIVGVAERHYIDADNNVRITAHMAISGQISRTRSETQGRRTSVMKNRSNAPSHALEKIIQLSSEAEHLSGKVVRTEEGIANARLRLTGGFTKDSDYDDTRSALDQLVADLPILKKKLRIAESTYENCKSFLDDLPKGAVLEPVEVNADGDLSEVRAKIEALEAELARLQSMPTPSADIEQRIKNYVHGLAKPQISGIGKGEQLKVVWPGSGWDEGGPRTNKAEVLPMMAMLFPNEMTAALLAEVTARIAELESELAELAYAEEALITAALAEGAEVQRSPNALPAAVLQVRVAETVKSKHAA
jgi:hypothetical protein